MLVMSLRTSGGQSASRRLSVRIKVIRGKGSTPIAAAVANATDEDEPRIRGGEREEDTAAAAAAAATDLLD